MHDPSPPHRESRDPSAPAASGRASFPWRLWLLLSALLVGNELGWNLWKLWNRFHEAKVLNSLSEDARGAMETLALEGLGMVAVAAVLLAGVGATLALLIDQGRRALAPRLTSRAARWLFWAGALIVGFNAWYSLHHVLMPGSRLDGSPLSVLSGALLPNRDGMEPARVAAALVCVPLMTVLLLRTLVVDRHARRLLLGGGAVLLLAVQGWSLATAPGAPTRFSAEGSVVMLGMDSLQANRLAHGGAPTDLAPRIDAFLRDSQRFDNAWTPFARTYPSWISLLSGRYPMSHGIRFNLLPDQHLAEDNHYLPQLLGEAGYATLHGTDEVRFCILRERFGYDDLLHPPMGVRDFFLGGFFDFSAANLARRTHLGHALFPAIAHNRAAVGYDPEIFTRDLIKRIDSLPADQPVFLSAHLCGDHWPFRSPAEYYWSHDDSIQACIAMVDDQVGAILDHLDATGLGERAVVALLSDHGDGWNGDPLDTENTHGDHLERLLANKVLLGLRAPGLGTGVHDELVRTIDLVPTLLELVDQPLPDGLDGRSLVPILRGEDDPPRRCFAESGFDKKTFTVARLVEEQSRWYTFDPHSGLVTLIPDELDELYAGKSYMVMEGDLRLLLVPARNELRLLRFDSWTGAEQPADDVPQAVVEQMLARLVEHYRLDPASVRALAHRRGFQLASLSPSPLPNPADHPPRGW